MRNVSSAREMYHLVPERCVRRAVLMLPLHDGENTMAAMRVRPLAKTTCQTVTMFNTISPLEKNDISLLIRPRHDVIDSCMYSGENDAGRDGAARAREQAFKMNGMNGVLTLAGSMSVWARIGRARMDGESHARPVQGIGQRAGRPCQERGRIKSVPVRSGGRPVADCLSTVLTARGAKDRFTPRSFRSAPRAAPGNFFPRSR